MPALESALGRLIEDEGTLLPPSFEHIQPRPQAQVAWEQAERWRFSANEDKVADLGGKTTIAAKEIRPQLQERHPIVPE